MCFQWNQCEDFRGAKLSIPAPRHSNCSLLMADRVTGSYADIDNFSFLVMLGMKFSDNEQKRILALCEYTKEIVCFQSIYFELELPVVSIKGFLNDCIEVSPRISQYSSSYPMSLIRYICGRVTLRYRANIETALPSLICCAHSVLELAPLVVWRLHPRELMLEQILLKSS